MARRIELTIDTKFVSDWGTEEGVREFIQNGLDAQDEYNATMTVDWSPGNGGTLRITNGGATLPLEALLLGHTTKADRDDLRGQYGEGLKLGTLALLRAGHKIVIRNGGDVWNPALEQSKVFNAEVLAFYVGGGRKDTDRVRVEIQGISKRSWTELRPTFRFLLTEDESTVVDTFHGSLLLAPEMAGRIYIKGIMVEHNPDFTYGYDLKFAKLDRDRKMVHAWDLKWETSKLWNEALQVRPDLVEPFWKLLASNETLKDIEGLSDFGHLSEEISVQLATKFAEQFGERAVPVATQEESREVEILAAKGIVSSAPLRKVLERIHGDISVIKEKLSQEKSVIYDWHDLSRVEKDNLEDALSLVGCVVDGLSIDIVDIVEFRSEALHGQYGTSTGRISLSKHIISDFRECLLTLVHEVAHHVASDSSVALDHVQVIESIWADVVVHLWNR